MGRAAGAKLCTPLQEGVFDWKRNEEEGWVEKEKGLLGNIPSSVVPPRAWKAPCEKSTYYGK
jgi:hypothetical protein